MGFKEMEIWITYGSDRGKRRNKMDNCMSNKNEVKLRLLIEGESDMRE